MILTTKYNIGDTVYRKIWINQEQKAMAMKITKVIATQSENTKNTVYETAVVENDGSISSLRTILVEDILFPTPELAINSIKQ